MCAGDEIAVRVYKVCHRTAWEEARAAGAFWGSADDVRNGYIHLSTAVQLEETLAKHFAGRTDLVLIEIDPVRLGTALRWEPARGGALFPHLYAPLEMQAVVSEAVLTLDDDGRHRLPETLTAC